MTLPRPGSLPTAGPFYGRAVSAQPEMDQED